MPSLYQEFRCRPVNYPDTQWWHTECHIVSQITDWYPLNWKQRCLFDTLGAEFLSGNEKYISIFNIFLTLKWPSWYPSLLNAPPCLHKMVSAEAVSCWPATQGARSSIAMALRVLSEYCGLSTRERLNRQHLNSMTALQKVWRQPSAGNIDPRQIAAILQTTFPTAFS